MADARPSRRMLVVVLVGAIGLLAGSRLETVMPLLADGFEQVPLRPDPAKVAEQAIAKWERLEYRTHGASVPCPTDAIVIATVGQSNAANSVGQRFAAKRAVFQRLQGQCYPASGPLLGSDLYAGSYWPLVGDLLVERGFAKSVVFVGIAKGNTSVTQWSDRGGLGGYLARRLTAEPEAKYVLWHQGEADSALTAKAYGEHLARVISIARESAPQAKVLIARASVCSGGIESAALRLAQSKAVDPAQGVFAGPDTDELRGDEFRYDECHFNASGAQAVARRWAEALMAAR